AIFMEILAFSFALFITAVRRGINRCFCSSRCDSIRTQSFLLARGARTADPAVSLIKTGKKSMQIITRAVFPVAGLGTRFLPATKANPKEMMPVVDKPLIQYAVEEAVAAGITELIFVTSSSKRAIEDHFDSNFELESTLIAKEKFELLQVVRNILPPGISCVYIRQHSPQGLG